MNTRILIGAAVLVLAIVFGFIFWNQFSSNQQNLAGGNPQMTQTYTKTSNNTAVKSNDNLDSIDSDLSGVNVTNIDSDSADMSTQLNGF